MKKALIIALTDGFIRSFLENDVELLKERGYEVHLAGRTSGREENVAFRQKHGVVFHEIAFSARHPFTATNIKALFAIRHLLCAEAFAVVHCHTSIVGVVTRLAAALCRFRKKGVLLYTSHGFPFHRHAPKRAWWLYYPMEWLAALWCDGIVTINREDYQNTRKMPCKHTFQINGVGMNRGRFIQTEADREAVRAVVGVAPDEIMLLGVGALSATKNFQLAIRGMSAAGIKNAVLVLCGNEAAGSGQRQYLAELAERLRVRVVFLGYRTDIPAIAHSADIGVLPSRKEGLGMAGLELLSAGLPLITSNVQGIRDYMQDGVNGYTVDPQDAAGFGRALVALSDPAIRQAMRQACVSSTAPFDREVTRQQLDDIYTQML